MHPQPMLERGHRGGPLRDWNPLQLRETRRPVLRLGREQRARVERVGHVGMGREQAVHHAARVCHRALPHVDARQVEPQPRVVGIVQERVFEEAARAAEIAACFGRACLRGLRLAAQLVDAARLGLLLGVEPVREFERFVAATLRGQRADKSADRVGIVGLTAQCHPVRRLRAARVAACEQRLAEQRLRRDVRRIQRDRAFEQRLRFRDFAVAARADCFARVGPVGRAGRAHLSSAPDCPPATRVRDRCAPRRIAPASTPRCPCRRAHRRRSGSTPAPTKTSRAPSRGRRDRARRNHRRRCGRAHRPPRRPARVRGPPCPAAPSNRSGP